MTPEINGMIVGLKKRRVQSLHVYLFDDQNRLWVPQVLNALYESWSWGPQASNNQEPLRNSSTTFTVFHQDLMRHWLILTSRSHVNSIRDELIHSHSFMLCTILHCLRSLIVDVCTPQVSCIWILVGFSPAGQRLWHLPDVSVHLRAVCGGGTKMSSVCFFQWEHLEHIWTLFTRQFL